MDQDMQSELVWFGGALVAFLAFLLFGGTSKPNEVAIAVGAFVISWAVISYSVKNFGPGSTSKKDLEKEFQWFTGILTVFLAVITLIGTTDDGVTLSYSVYAMAVFGFTLVWVVRSVAIKKFS
ncbi:MAG: hypothetical protein QF822_00950 [Candidatus Poseidoniia archaeon]|jgi:hypothetical protein|nr:hypothetical protein [Euryarchaeota archaeon]MDP6533781.1 hypothetical protein [Candidatus Poseidoniia archaeon]MDP6835426.1 hypothetical protein [Candidatus Poseidoniia archaeon]HIH78796.1 hypothetical protein [Candidatus Poseidoniia archaeon]|tara:strand:+ start:275 stop:643 length:369 start_codon:yes stop_codon:yes gene_type:complete